MPALQTENVAVASWFLEIDGTGIVYFKSVSGLSVEMDVVTLTQNTANGKTTHVKSVGVAGLKPGQITCSRGLILDDSMWKWTQLVIDGKVREARKNISLALFSADGNEIKRYNFINAWPSAWSLGEMDATGTDALMETVTIEHEGFSLAGKNGV